MTKAICVWYWFIFLPYICPFLKKLFWTIYCWLCKQNITWLRRSVRKRKAETVQSDIVGNYPSAGYVSWISEYSWKSNVHVYSYPKAFLNFHLNILVLDFLKLLMEHPYTVLIYILFLDCLSLTWIHWAHMSRTVSWKKDRLYCLLLTVWYL